MKTKLNTLLDNACNSVQYLIGTGKVADYIPALARVDKNKFGAAILTVDGEYAQYGDSEEPFSIQSISKVFALTQVLNLIGDDLWQRVHHEPSGNSFNSIVQLEMEKGIPRNPFINAGAIVVSDILLRGHTTESCTSSFLEFLQLVSNDNSISIDTEVALSELMTANRNISLASFMKSFNNIEHNINDVLHVYCNHCSVSMNCKQLSRSMLFLAKQGLDPLSGQSIVTDQRA